MGPATPEIVVKNGQKKGGVRKTTCSTMMCRINRYQTGKTKRKKRERGGFRRQAGQNAALHVGKGHRH